MGFPKAIYQDFNNFGDGEYAVDPVVVKRIREEFDPFFCPLFRLQVWQYADGGTRKFKNFGVGASSREDVPVNWTIRSAMRACTGYLSRIEPASDVVVWWPFDSNADGTPGTVIPFSDNIYYLVKRTFERTKELEYMAKKASETQALTFAREFLVQEQAAKDKAWAFEKSEAAYRLKGELPSIRKNIEETTQADVDKFYDSQNRAPKPFVHLSESK